MRSERFIHVPDTAARAGPHNGDADGDAGRVGDPPHGSEVGEGVPETTTRTHTLYRETMAQNTDRAGIFGDSFMDLNVKASRGRHGAERADPPTPGGSGVEGECPGEETARKDSQRRRRSIRQKTDRIRLRTNIGTFIESGKTKRPLYFRPEWCHVHTCECTYTRYQVHIVYQPVCGRCLI